MSKNLPPPIPALLPETAPFSPSSAPGSTASSPAFSASMAAASRRSRRRANRRADAGHAPAGRPARRRRRRRSAVARPDHAATGPHEARRRPAAAAAHDGGDGAAGLRPVRLQLQGLFGRAVYEEGRAAEPVRARRQGHAAHAQEAARGVSRRAGACERPGDGARKRSRARIGSGAAKHGRTVARQSGRGGLPQAHATQQAGLEQGDLARRHRSSIQRPRLRGRRRVRYRAHQRSRARRRGDPRDRRAGGFSRSADARCARCSPTACRSRPRPTCCSSCSPI